MSRAKVGIVGAGTMGAGIAQVALEGGWDVVLHDPQPGATARARSRIADGLARRAAKLGADADGIDDWVGGRLAGLSVVPSVAAIAAESQLVVEAALEDLELKRGIFRELDAAADAGTILASNTSALSIAKIAEATRRPERVVGLHFFNPAPVLPLVEVVATAATEDDVVSRAIGFVEGWGKTPIRCADSPGFIVNRVNRPFTLEPLRLVHAGVATIETVDAAITEAGFPMGPFRLMDLIGIDVNLAAARGLWEGFGRAPRFRPSPIQEELVAAGRLGRKTGEGFYRYGDGGAVLGTAARFAGPLRPRPGVEPIEPEAISERVILAIVNEAYRALGDRVATAGDIDLAMRLGANHPFGPFAWAGETGLQEVALGLDGLSDEDADTFRPALELLRAARRAG
ncbi:MAG TPA: 3-hydroxyacyl-CoA dehydrogenase NAD-binding domain-containing protein [Candidatus Limnocylindrales bacterium]